MRCWAGTDDDSIVLIHLSLQIMTPLENHRRSVIEFNRHDPGVTAVAYAPNAIVHDPLHAEPLHGRESIREDYAAFFSAFPDIQTEIIHVVTEGPYIAIAYHMRLTGTHTGPRRTAEGDIPASGLRLELPAAVFAHANEEGEYTTVRRFYDTSTLLRQLGATPEPLAQ
jgi:predicted ester cyclase